MGNKVKESNNTDFGYITDVYEPWDLAHIGESTPEYYAGMLEEIPVTAKAWGNTPKEANENYLKFRKKKRKEQDKKETLDMTDHVRSKRDATAPYAAMLPAAAVAGPLVEATAAVAPMLAPGTAGGNFIGNAARDMLAYELSNHAFKTVTGTTPGEQIRNYADYLSNGAIPRYFHNQVGGDVLYEMLTEAPTFAVASKAAPLVEKGVEVVGREAIPVIKGLYNTTNLSTIGNRVAHPVESVKFAKINSSLQDLISRSYDENLAKSMNSDLTKFARNTKYYNRLGLKNNKLLDPNDPLGYQPAYIQGQNEIVGLGGSKKYGVTVKDWIRAHEYGHLFEDSQGFLSGRSDLKRVKAPVKGYFYADETDPVRLGQEFGADVIASNLYPSPNDVGTIVGDASEFLQRQALTKDVPFSEMYGVPKKAFNPKDYLHRNRKSSGVPEYTGSVGKYTIDEFGQVHRFLDVLQRGKVNGEVPIISKEVSASTFNQGYTDPKDLSLLFKLWRERYPNAKLTKPSINGSYMDGTGMGENWLTIANVGLPNDNIAFARYWKNRTNNIGVNPNDVWGRYSDPATGNVITMRYPTKIEHLAQNTQKLGIPVDNTMRNTKGMHIRHFDGREDFVIMADPWRKKSYDYSMLHEGFMHPTESEIFELKIPQLNGKSVGAAYLSVAYPTDIVDKSILDKLYTTQESKYAKEARAINGELVKLFTLKISEISGKPFEEILNNPKYIEEIFDKNFNGNIDRLSSFLKSMDSGYTNDWAKILDSDLVSQLAKLQYAKRLVTMLKYLPQLSVPVTVGGVVASLKKQG